MTLRAPHAAVRTVELISRAFVIEPVDRIRAVVMTGITGLTRKLVTVRVVVRVTVHAGSRQAYPESRGGGRCLRIRVAGDARNRDVGSLETEPTFLVVPTDIKTGGIPGFLVMTAVARPATRPAAELPGVFVEVARGAAVGGWTRIRPALHAGEIPNSHRSGIAGGPAVAGLARGFGVRPFEREADVVIEPAAQRLLGNPVPSRRGVTGGAGRAHPAVMFVPVAARALPKREAGEPEIGCRGRRPVRGCPDPARSRRTVFLWRVTPGTLDPPVKPRQPVPGPVVVEPSGVFPPVLPVARVAGLSRELIAVRVLVPVAGETLRVEPEIGARE